MQTATNSETGERVALVGAEWKPIEQTATNDRGEKAYLVSGTWLTDKAPEPSLGERAARTAGLGARAVVKGVTAIPALMADAAAVPLRAATGGRLFKNAPSADLDAALTAAGLPEPGNATERVMQDIVSGMGVQGAVVRAGRALSNAAGPVVSRVGKLLAGSPGMQTAGAATGSAAAGVARESDVGPLGQLAAGVAGGMTPAAAGSLVTRKPTSPALTALLAESERRDVPLTYSDITGKGRRLDTALEQVPVVGTSRFRESGAKKATAAIEGYADEVSQGMRGTEFRGLQKLKDAANAGDKSAKATLDQIENAGDDWTKIMQASGNMKLWRSRQAADELYSRVETIANTRGEVPLAKTTAALDSAIAAESSSKLPDQQLIAKLTEIKTNLGSGNNFTAIRQLRSDIGDLVQNYYKGANAAVGAKGVDKLQAVRSAVEGDMEAFATGNGGDLHRAWRRADSFYKSAVVPFKDKALAQALKSDLPDEVYRKFIQVSRSGGGEDRAQKFYDALDPKGRAAVRYGMIANAIDSASIPEKDGLLSPGKFAQSLDSIDKASGVFFKGNDKSELDGFKNLMEHARRFGQFSENPPTGQRVIPWLVLGGAAIRPAEMAAVGTAAYAARQIITTDAGKRFLLEASVLKPGTPEMQRLAEELARQMPRLASQQGAQTRTEKREPQTEGRSGE